MPGRAPQSSWKGMSEERWRVEIVPQDFQDYQATEFSGIELEAGKYIPW